VIYLKKTDIIKKNEHDKVF